MESRQSTTDKDIESLIAEIRRLIEPATNSNSEDQTPLQKSTEKLLKYIEEYILAAYSFSREGIHIEKDLIVLQVAIQQPESLDSIELLYRRCLHNIGAHERRKKVGIGSTTVGVFGMAGALALTLFPPTALAGVAAYGAIGGAVVGSTASSTGAGLIASNKRETLAALEKSIIDMMLEDFKQSKNYFLFAQAGLTLIKTKLEMAESLTDNDIATINSAIKLITDQVSKEEIAEILENTKTNISAPDEINELITLLKKSPENEADILHNNNNDSDDRKNNFKCQ